MRAFGLVVLLLGVAVTILSMPIFPLTGKQTNNLPPVQKTDTIMDYSFKLKLFSATKEVPIDISPGQTLNIQASTNSVSQGLFGNTQLKFDFYIVTRQVDGIDAIYFSREGIASVNAQWSPPTNGQYIIRFYSPKAAGGFNVDMDINAHVTKTYSVNQVETVNVTEVKSLVDSRSLVFGFVLLFSGIAVLAASFLFPKNRIVSNIGSL